MILLHFTIVTKLEYIYIRLKYLEATADLETILPYCNIIYHVYMTPTCQSLLTVSFVEHLNQLLKHQVVLYYRLDKVI